MLNIPLIFPAIKVRLSGSKMKSLPSIQIITSHDTVLQVYTYAYLYTYVGKLFLSPQ